MAANNMDWQIGIRHVSHRARKILESGQWSDCVFIVGTENRKQTIQAHRLLLAMASPVFEAMFFGSMADKEDKPIEILDVQPQAFKALLKYVYADEISFASFDQVCEICYAAKKYMIPPLVEECTRFIWQDLHPGNVCRAYAFVRLFEEPQLLEKCMDMIKELTRDVLRDQSFEDVDISTLKSILSQETLNCCESELWDGVVRWSKQECSRQALDPTPDNQRKMVQELLPLFRFLTLTPNQFANGPAVSSILSQEECFSLLMNISSPGVSSVPPNFSTSTTSRKPPPKQPRQPSTYQHMRAMISSAERERLQANITCDCASNLANIFINEQLVDCSLSFSVDTDVQIVGVVLPTQLRVQMYEEHGIPMGQNSRPVALMTSQLSHKYAELIYAFLQDSTGSRLTYTHFSARVSWDSTMEVIFNRPLSLLPNTTYKIVVVLNKMGRYPLYNTHEMVLVNDVRFSFDENDPRESIVKSLLFKRAHDAPRDDHEASYEMQ